MTYLPRFLEKRLLDYGTWFRAVLLLGARQVGKTTLLKHLYPELKIITFDPVLDIHGARRDPDLFLDSFPAPLILDEIQYVPELFPALKRRIDESDKKGQYFLSGSQNPLLLRQVAESMAGRVGILELDQLHPEELRGHGDCLPWLHPWLGSEGIADPTRFHTQDPVQQRLLSLLWRGGLPGILELPDRAVQPYLNSYFHTYIERDVRLAGDVRDIDSFGRFVALCAALSGQEINRAQLGRDIGVAAVTAQKWLEILRMTYQWHELPAYSGNTVKRLSGKAKGYFSDTGLACLLQRLSSEEALAVSPLKGAFFETLVINGLRQQQAVLPSLTGMYHWRTTGGAEVDAVLELDGKHYLVECKCTTQLSRHDLRGIMAFRATYQERAPAVIVYAGHECRKLDDLTLAMPI